MRRATSASLAALVLTASACGADRAPGDAADATATSGDDATVATGLEPDATDLEPDAMDAVVASDTSVAADATDTSVAADATDTAVATDASVMTDTSGATDATDLEPDATDTTATDAPDVTPDPTDATDPDATDPDAADASPADDVFGVLVPRADAWWVEGGVIHHGDAAVRLRGINWFGLETPDRALHGTWTGRTVQSFLGQIAGLGFNALRIPVSPDTIRPGLPSASWANAAYGPGPATTTGRDHLEKLLTAADAAGLYVLLDFHSCSSGQIGGALPGRPDGCAGYAILDWHDDLAALAALGATHPSVMGVDLLNEPHALSWNAWKADADAAGEVVLRANPAILVFVEGVGNASDAGPGPAFWGENLTHAADTPSTLPASRLVLSPHVYGPAVASMPYFGAADYPANLPTYWAAHFGHLVGPDHAVVVGEFGGTYDDAKDPGEVAWNDAFVAYLAAFPEPSFFYWALNPNSGDTGGLLGNDWQTPVAAKVRLLAPLLAQ